MKTLSNDISTNQLAADFKVVIADAEALLKATTDQGGDKVAEIRAKVENSLKIAKDRLDEAQAAVIAQTRAAAKATDVYVHENPWNAVGVAVGIGFIIGWLTGRR